MNGIALQLEEVRTAVKGLFQVLHTCVPDVGNTSDVPYYQSAYKWGGEPGPEQFGVVYATEFTVLSARADKATTDIDQLLSTITVVGGSIEDEAENQAGNFPGPPPPLDPRFQVTWPQPWLSPPAPWVGPPVPSGQ